MNSIHFKGFFLLLNFVLLFSCALVGASSGKVAINAKLAKVDVLEANGGAVSGTTQTAENGGSFSEPLSVNYDQKLRVRFRLESEDPTALEIEQSFVRLTHRDSDVAVTVNAPSSPEGKAKAVLDMKTLASRFAYTSGTYDISLILAGSRMSNPTQWHLGSVDISLPSNKRSSKRSAGTTFGKPLPEIHHVFREADARPPAAISLAASIAVLAPSVFLAFGVLRFALPNIQAANLGTFGLFFQALLASIVVLYTLYWLQLNMFQTITALGVLAPLTALVGAKSLRSIKSKNE